ncbi:MAG: aminoacyl-tRNA hydrolase [bacterium]|nr:aminoacyl-tRNA hydrolase [bacterium]
MKLIIGLGNPDKKYETTRHNIGFRVIDELVNTKQYQDLVLKDYKKFFGQYAKNNKIILLKPMTYMNNSGQSVQAVVNYYDIDLGNVLIIHDDMDLDFGQIKIQKNKSAAGHNGVDSIINSINSNDFWRLRIGINNELKKRIPGDKFVVSNFTAEEEKQIGKIIEPALDFIIEFINSETNELTNKNFQIPV